jgi:hypothetical protein
MGLDSAPKHVKQAILEGAQDRKGAVEKTKEYGRRGGKVTASKKDDVGDYRRAINAMIDRENAQNTQDQKDAIEQKYEDERHALREEIGSVVDQYELLSENGKKLFLDKVEELSGIGPVKTIEDVMENKVFEKYREQAMAHAQVFGNEKM